jgi:hypothetical protein
MKLLTDVVSKLRFCGKGLPANFNFDKKDLIDYLYRRCRPVPVSFADLGGIWNVDGAYTFYTLRNYGAKFAFLVDSYFTDAFLEKSRTQAKLKLIHGDFGEQSVARQIGTVDAIFLFDVLLHQVNPDWNEILELYSKQTKYFVVYNPQGTASENTVRLLDLARMNISEMSRMTWNTPPIRRCLIGCMRSIPSRIGSGGIVTACGNGVLPITICCGRWRI